MYLKDSVVHFFIHSGFLFHHIFFIINSFTCFHSCLYHHYYYIINYYYSHLQLISIFSSTGAGPIEVRWGLSSWFTCVDKMMTAGLKKNSM